MGSSWVCSGGTSRSFQVLCSSMTAKSQKFETKQEVQSRLPGPEMLQKLLFVKSLRYVFKLFLYQSSLLGSGLWYLEVSVPGIAVVCH